MRRMRDTAAGMALLTLVTVGVLAHGAFSPTKAFACDVKAPCNSPVATVLCPFPNTTGTGEATFNLPKAARNVRYRIVDANTDAVYDSDHPICKGTSMTVTDQFTPGANEDQLKVTYQLSAGASSDPNEQHDVRVIAEWDLENDLGVTKTLLDGSSANTFGAEREVSFALTIHNYGAYTTGVAVADKFATGGVLNAGFVITRVEQTKGSDPIDAPTIFPDNSVVGRWGVLEPGKEIVVVIHGYSLQGGIVQNTATLVSTDPGFAEPATDLHPNKADFFFGVEAAPDTALARADATRVKGTSTAGVAAPPATAKRAATDVATVQVAILQAGGGRPFAGLAQDKAGATACKWVKNAKAKFEVRQPADGICDSPLWLNAKGTAKWSFRLKHALPKGHYVVYSRAIAEDGAAEGFFDSADGNTKEIRVR